jgi:hypothetical protein
MPKHPHHPSKSFRRPWKRVGWASAICTIIALVVHLSWLKGYTADPTAAIKQLPVKADAQISLFTANLIKWRDYLVPAFSLIFATAFKDALGEFVKSSLLSRLKSIFSLKGKKRCTHKKQGR